MGVAEDLLMCIADEVTLNPDNVTKNELYYGEKLIMEKDKIDNPLAIENMLHDISQYGDWRQRTFILSLCMSYSGNSKYLKEMVNYLLDNIDNISLDSLNFFQWQARVRLFMNPKMATLELKQLVWELYDRVMDKYVSFFRDEIIPIEGCDENFVIVFTEQFLSEAHGPTKTALDRCKILMEKMHKKVLLINTGEYNELKGRVPFYSAALGNYNEDIYGEDKMEWKGVTVPYYQCSMIMPEMEEVRAIVSMVRKTKPAFAISIGTGNVVLSLVSKLIPVLTVSLSPSEISPTTGWSQTYSKDLEEEDIELLKYLGRDENHIIKGTFGSSVVDIGTKRTKESIGLKESDFVILLVGGRLKEEADDAFWEMIDRCNIDNLQVIVLGVGQEEIEPSLKNHRGLIERVHALGMLKDPLGYMCAADIYVNPKRRGGGTSSVEALSVGVPVVSVDYGDVAVNVGGDFVVDSYDEMIGVINRYHDDTDYYMSQSKKAIEKSKELLNAEDTFVDIVDEFLERVKKGVVPYKKEI